MDARDRMEHRPYAPWIPWAMTSVLLVLVAIAAYAVGVSQQTAGGGEPFRRFWFGSGFWLFILFWMVFGSLRRMLWWHWGGWGPWGYRYRPWRYDYPHPYDHERAEWEAWHRREHERSDASRSERGPSPSGPDRGSIT